MPFRLEIAHLKAESRMLSVLLAGALIQDNLDPALLIFNVPQSMVGKAAVMTGHPTLLAWAFLACSLALVPFLAVSLIKRLNPWRVRTSRIACAGLCGGGLLWLLMGYVASGHGTGTVSQIFLRSAIVSIGFAAALAVSINNKQAREFYAAEQRGEVPQ